MRVSCSAETSAKRFLEWFDRGVDLDEGFNGTMAFGLSVPTDSSNPSALERMMWLLLDEEPHSEEELGLPEFGGPQWQLGISLLKRRGLVIATEKVYGDVFYRFDREESQLTTEASKKTLAAVLEILFAIDGEGGHELVKKVMMRVPDHLCPMTPFIPGVTPEWWMLPDNAY